MGAILLVLSVLLSFILVSVNCNRVSDAASVTNRLLTLARAEGVDATPPKVFQLLRFFKVSTPPPMPVRVMENALYGRGLKCNQTSNYCAKITDIFPTSSCSCATSLVAFVAVDRGHWT